MNCYPQWPSFVKKKDRNLYNLHKYGKDPNNCKEPFAEIVFEISCICRISKSMLSLKLSVFSFATTINFTPESVHRPAQLWWESDTLFSQILLWFTKFILTWPVTKDTKSFELFDSWLAICINPFVNWSIEIWRTYQKRKIRDILKCFLRTIIRLT